MLTYIDHVTMVVHDIETAIETLRDRLSLFVSPARNQGSSPLVNAVIPFNQGYLEVLSIANRKTPHHEALNELNAFLEAGEGLFSFAINTSNIKGDVSALQSRGSRLQEPVHETWSDAEGGPGWWISRVLPGAHLNAPYLIQYDQSPENRAQRAALSQPFAIRSIEEVTIIIPGLDQALGDYERDFGLKPTRQVGGRGQISLTGSKINLVPAKLAPLGTPLGLYSVGLGSTDINGSRSVLRSRDIELFPDSFSWAVASQIDPRETFSARIDLLQL